MPPDRLLPSASDSEIALLAACVLDPASVYLLQTETTPASFTGARAAIREILCDIIPTHGKASHGTLDAEYRRRELPLDGLRDLQAIREAIAPLASWSYHLDRVRSCELRRAILRRAESLSTLAGNGSTDADVLAELSGLAGIADAHAAHRDLVLTGSEITPLVRQERMAESGVLIDIRMGDRFPGIRRGELMTVMGRMWTGKSLWASQAALNSHAATLIVSLEMPAAQWWRRLLAQLWGMHPRRAVDAVTYGRMTDDEARALADVEKRISITQGCDGSWPSVQAAYQRIASAWGHPPALVVIDHLDYLRPIGRVSSEYDRLSGSVRECQRFARRNSVALLLISQVGRAEGADGSTELGLQSARGTGKIEEDSAHLLGIWRPSHRKGLDSQKAEELKPELRGRLLKQRDGSGFRWDFRLDPETLRITPTTEADA